MDKPVISVLDILILVAYTMIIHVISGETTLTEFLARLGFVLPTVLLILSFIRLVLFRNYYRERP